MKNNKIMTNQPNLLSCRERFPIEIWSYFLKKHIAPGSSFNNLLDYRYVCKDIKNIIDEILKEKALSSLHNSFFLDSWPNYLKSFMGTKFSTEEEVARFISAMEGFKGNPFPNGTVIISPKEGGTTEELGDLFGALRSLVVRFREYISCLVLGLSDNYTETEFILSIVNVFKLKNLKCLLIHKTKWQMLSGNGSKIVRELKDLAQENCLPVPIKLAQFQVFGEDGFLPFVYSFLYFKDVIKNLTHLRIDCSSSSNPQQPYYVDQVISKNISALKSWCQYLKLEKLTMVNPTKASIDLLNPISAGVPSTLKQFSCSISRPSMVNKLVKCLNELNRRAESLQLLHLFVESHVPAATQQDNQEEELGLQVPFKKVTHLIFNQPLKTFDRPTFHSILCENCPNLKKVTFLLNPSTIRENTPESIFRFINSSLWPRLFPQADIVHVPYFGWKLVKGQTSTFQFQNQFFV